MFVTEEENSVNEDELDVYALSGMETDNQVLSDGN